ncbi:TrbI/VirB10 family protein [Burkholderia contaminans]|uniref:TrbI/VirB10 family protein n=1 Tax=Burkholderia contaminans TaxID=488447 RepID=UPI00118A3AEB|nr:TrbI/VirB10 family protein [Burkholderia contaminans]QDS32411.1 TrbI/VirB10 family protein [Burkholderia contaminans]
MRLRDKTVEAADQDRIELKEQVVAGATPGQKLIGGLTAFAAVGVILGGLGYKFWYLPAHGGPVPTALQQQEQKADQAPRNRQPCLSRPARPPRRFPACRLLAANLRYRRDDGRTDRRWQLRWLGRYGASECPARTAAYAGAGSREGEARGGSEDRPRSQARERHGSDAGRGDSGIMPVSAQPQQPGGMPGVTPAFPMPGMGGNGGSAQSGDFSARLIPTSTPKVTATLIPNPTFTVKKGTPISCTLDTAINSETLGFVSCTVSRPVYGMDSRVVLIDRGSTVDGEISKGPERGKARAPVLWGRIVTPLHVAIQVNSPGTDTLGAAGITGSIDNHYCERFCGAFLFSSMQDLIQGGMQALTSKSSGSTNIVLPQNTLNSGQTAAAEILQQGRDVTATFSKNQGDEISITVARDLDFSSAYHLESAQQ